ncbi:multidrug efflux MFS transporter [Nicoliella spurrieriana]|uniref:Multidrug efflux MFS transporter n=1 Tax=Nicoliella spurrieriana TaxID=2925830 RepID=A0A976RSP1_9LACO|nr:MDR family MFS transporter [Nicoliella spurrieriana]UQS87083.1 multidrug efflux MFS transporter [Nicoliella spurrieriana]
MDKPLDQNGKPYSRMLLVIFLLIGTFCTVLNQTLLATAYPKLMSVFDIDTSTVQWLTSGFLMVNGILIPVTAWLSGRFNTKWLYISAMVIFEIGTVMCFAAPNFATLLSGRLIQAVGVGISMPMLQTIMLSIFPAEKRGTAMGLSGIVIGLAPAIGPTVSGWIIVNAQWRDLFGMIIPIVGIVIIISLWTMKPILPTSKTKLDFSSLLLSTIGFGSALYAFSSVGDKGWGSSLVISTLVIGIIFIILFILREFRTDNPLVNLNVFRSKQFSVGSIIGALAMMSMIGFEMILPLYLQIVRGYNAFHSGLTLLAGAMMIGVLSPFTGRIFDKYGARYLGISGFLLLSIGTIPFFFITTDMPIMYVVVIYAIRSCGIAMSMMTITTYSMNALQVNMMNHGTAANNTLRQVASSMATAVMTSVLTNVTNNAKPAHHLLTVDPLQYKSKMLDAVLSGYHAAFLVAFIFGIIGLAFTFLIKRGKSIPENVKGGNK